MAIKRDAADIAFSNAVRLFKRYTCEHCKRTAYEGYPQMELAHIYGRASKSVRWCVDNALCLCHTCHAFFTANPVDFMCWLTDHIGQGMIQLLNEKRNKIQKTTKDYRKEVAKHYRREIKLMEAGEHELVSFQ